MNKTFDYCLFLGRFQPLHIGHIATINKALELADRVIVMVGSAYQPRTPKNPFTVEERWEMISKALPNVDLSKIIFTYSYDFIYNDQKWVEEVQQRVKTLIPNPKARIGIIGHKKDTSSYYLDLFPQWEYVDMPHVNLINATDIRDIMFNEMFAKSFINKTINTVCNNLHESTFNYIINFSKTEAYKTLKMDYDYIKKYKESWANAPFPPTFVTVDAVVVQSGHVLMVRRGAHPGFGNLALPGGFLDQEETTLEGAIRELKEETKIKLPIPVLKGSLKGNKLFDHPRRSLRGRSITHAFLFELEKGELIKVKGGDDASKALWVRLADLEDLRDQIFEDHFDIIMNMIGSL